MTFSVGIFINTAVDLERLKTLMNCQVQLGFYRISMYKDFGLDTREICKQNNLSMNSIHLPTKDITTELIDEIMCLFNVELATIHAFDTILETLKDVNSYIMCLENFPYKNKRKYRTPIDIIGVIAGKENLSMTFDICHAETLWLDSIIRSSILKYAKIIHLSNKLWNKRPKDVVSDDKETGYHVPIHGYKGIVDVDKVLHITLKQYAWKGEIVLEYMPQYFEKAKSDLINLERNWGKF